MIHKKYLEYLGLSEKEATIYIELLRADTLSGIALCRRTEIKKATVYVILASLISKKLVKEVKVGKRIHYCAESPDQFKEMFEQKSKEMETQLKKVNEIVNELKAIERYVGERPIVRFYEGKEALRESIDEYVAQAGYSPGDDYGIYSYDRIEKILSKRDVEEVDEKRIKNNIKFKVIYSGGNKYMESRPNQELIKIAQDQFPIESEISIFNDEVLIHTFGKDVHGISIKSREFSTTMKSIIDYIFSMQKP